MGVLDDISAGISEVLGKVAPAVVGIGRSGSGVVLRRGAVVTNAHNLRRGEATVHFAGGRHAAAEVAGVDLDGDLAVMGVDTGELEGIGWAPEPASAGSLVVALANPGGWGVRASLGVVSAVDVSFRGPGGRMVDGAFEHTAPLARGSSGGPVVDAAGRLVGLDTHRLGDGFYLALAASPELETRLDALGRGEVPQRARLGIAVAPSAVARRMRRSVGLAERDGLLVRAVEEGGPAAAAGILPGDLVVAIAGTAVADVDQLATLLAATSTPVVVDLVRGAEELQVRVDLGGS